MIKLLAIILCLTIVSNKEYYDSNGLIKNKDTQVSYASLNDAKNSDGWAECDTIYLDPGEYNSGGLLIDKDDISICAPLCLIYNNTSATNIYTIMVNSADNFEIYGNGLVLRNSGTNGGVINIYAEKVV